MVFFPCFRRNRFLRTFHVFLSLILPPFFYAYYENPSFPADDPQRVQWSFLKIIHSGTRITVVVCRKPRVIKTKWNTYCEYP